MVEYSNRESRQKFIAEKFGDYLKGSVLNIGGGGDKALLNYCQPNEYIELDMCGEPDLLIDLDKEYPLPIEDNRYNTIICTEVLEHLDEFHRVFEELLRISSSNIIISLPNALMTFRDYLKGTKYKGNAGEGGVEVGYYTKFYGLPLNKPPDRHRWFFLILKHQNSSIIMLINLDIRYLMNFLLIRHPLSKASYWEYLFGYFLVSI